MALDGCGRCGELFDGAHNCGTTTISKDRLRELERNEKPEIAPMVDAILPTVRSNMSLGKYAGDPERLYRELATRIVEKVLAARPR